MHNVMAGKLGSRSARVFPSFLALVSVAACLYPTCSNKLDIDEHIWFMTFSSSEEAQEGTSSFQYTRCLNEFKNHLIFLFPEFLRPLQQEKVNTAFTVRTITRTSIEGIGLLG